MKISDTSFKNRDFGSCTTIYCYAKLQKL